LWDSPAKHFSVDRYIVINIEIDIEGVPPTAWGPPLDGVVTLLLYVLIEDYRYKKSGYHIVLHA
jgi:hypothetical protein